MAAQPPGGADRQAGARGPRGDGAASRATSTQPVAPQAVRGRAGDATTSATAPSPTSRRCSSGARSRAASTTTPRRSKLLAAYRERRDARTGTSRRRSPAATRPRSTTKGSTPLHRLWKRTRRAALAGRARRAALPRRARRLQLSGVPRAAVRARRRTPRFPIGIKPDAADRVGGPAGAVAAADDHEPRARRHLPRRAAAGSARRRDRVPRPGGGEDRQGAVQPERRARQQRRRELFLKGDLGRRRPAPARRRSATRACRSSRPCSTRSTTRSARANTGADVRIAPEDITALQAQPARSRSEVGPARARSRPTTATARTSTSRCASRQRQDAALHAARGKHDAAPEGFIEIDVGGLGGPPERRAFAWQLGRVPRRAAGRLPRRLQRSRRWSSRWRGSSATGCTPTSPSWWYGRGALPKSLPSRSRCAAHRHAAAVGRGSGQAEGAALAVQPGRQGGLAAAARGAAREAQRRREDRSSCCCARTAPRGPASSPSA